MKSKSIQNLVQSLSRMPSIGLRTAERLALYVARASDKDIEVLMNAIRDVRSQVGHCQKCYHMAEGSLCSICADPNRDAKQLCVVEQSADVLSIEKSGVYRGLYHVLLGAFSPLDGIGPSDIEIGSLMNRLKNAESLVSEVIVATNPTANGEATALYLTKAIRSLNKDLRITRIGFGVAMGSDLSYVDKFTLSKSLQTRTDIGSV